MSGTILAYALLFNRVCNLTLHLQELPVTLCPASSLKSLLPALKPAVAPFPEQTINMTLCSMHLDYRLQSILLLLSRLYLLTILY